MHKALQQQQEMIEKLLSERQGVKEALQRVENDITQLRGEKEVLMVCCWFLGWLLLVC